MFENMIYSFMLILILLNGTFIAVSTLPVTQDGSVTFADSWGIQKVIDINSSINIFGSQIPITAVVVDTNTEATTTENEKVDVFKAILFGIGTAVGAAVNLINFMYAVLFGFNYWLDMLLVPSWHPLVAALNTMLKVVFFIISIVGIVNFAKGFFIFRNLF